MIFLELTDKQKVAFNKLKKAYKDCVSAGIILVNNYGHLEAYDNKIVQGYADGSFYDKDAEDVVNTIDFQAANSLRISNEWTDDTHLIKLTPTGLKKLKNGEL